MHEQPILREGDLVLRQPEDGDLAARLALGRDPEIVRMFGGDTADALAPFTEAEAARWLQRLAQHPHGWIVEHDGQLLGEARLDSLDLRDGRARLATGILDSAKLGQGYGRRIVRLLLRHGFGTLKLHRIDLRVLAYNERAIRCYVSCGFREEGREREAALIDGQRHDDVIMGQLSREFSARGPS